MKEIRIQDASDEELEACYMQQYNPWKIERELLGSHSKQELADWIQSTEKSWRAENMLYKYGLSRKKFRAGYESLGTLGKYLVEQYAYHFEGGKELEMSEKFLEKLKRYYKEQFEVSGSYKKEKFDITSLSLPEVISRYISLPKNLRRNIKCPLHRDKTASFRIYPQTQSFYCFGCHKGGNAVNFVAEIEQIPHKEAFKKLAHLYSKY